MATPARDSRLTLKAAFDAVYDSLDKRDPDSLAIALSALRRLGHSLSDTAASGRNSSPLYTLITRFGSAKPDQCKKCLLLLEQFGADLSEPHGAADSHCPLSAACLKANLAACEFFLERGAIPGEAAFQCAIDYRRIEIFKAMLDACAPERLAALVPWIHESLSKANPFWKSQSFYPNSKNEEKCRSFRQQARAFADAALLRCSMPTAGQNPAECRSKPRI